MNYSNQGDSGFYYDDVEIEAYASKIKDSWEYYDYYPSQIGLDDILEEEIEDEGDYSWW
jgi:hypothetical protein